MANLFGPCLADELSMHLLTTPLLYRILTFKASPEKTRLVGIVLSVLFVTVMFFHMVLNEFLLHAITFGIAVLTIAVRTSKLLGQQVPDPYMRKKLRNVSIFGICEWTVFEHNRALRLTRANSLLCFWFLRVAH